MLRKASCITNLFQKNINVKSLGFKSIAGMQMFLEKYLPNKGDNLTFNFSEHNREDYRPNTDEVNSILMRYPNIQGLNLTGTFISNIKFELLTKIESLSLFCTDVSLSSLYKLTNLRSLQFILHTSKDEFIQACTNLTKLEKLNISGEENIIIDCLPHFPESLKCLTMPGYKLIGSHFITMGKKLKRIEFLNFSANPNFTVESLYPFSSLRSLQLNINSESNINNLVNNSSFLNALDELTLYISIDKELLERGFQFIPSGVRVLNLNMFYCFYPEDWVKDMDIPLERFDKLQKLSLSHIDLSDLCKVKFPINLEVIELRYFTNLNNLEVPNTLNSLFEGLHGIYCASIDKNLMQDVKKIANPERVTLQFIDNCTGEFYDFSG